MNDDNGSNGKLDWMYKGANSLVDREEYLLGKSVDKSLEQLNAEEKEKKLGIVPPKNHVEHECIPPSIRDFNKIVHTEQVDISAKLQEDPLVAIKKREEEARRQFLQNPVQLKKLQEALKAQELKKNKGKHKKSKESDLDGKIAKKLKYLKADALGASFLTKNKKKSKDDVLDTILMHKFNELKDRLSQDDLNDILAGKVSDSDDETDKDEKKYKRKNDSSSEENLNKKKLKKKEKERKSCRNEKYLKKTTKKRKDSSSSGDSSSDSSSDDEKSYKRNRKKEINNKSYDKSKNSKKSSKEVDYKNKRRKYSSSEDSSDDKSKEKDRKYKKKLPDKKSKRNERTGEENSVKNEVDKNQKIMAPDFDLESKILEKLRILRESSKSKRNNTSSDSESKDMSKTSPTTSDTSDNDTNAPENHANDSDSDEQAPKSRAFGLVKADGTKIALNKTRELKKSDQLCKVETVTKPERKNVKKLSEEEKERMRREMMKNAEKRDKERSDNLRKYREEDKREEKSAADFDKDFLHKQLLRSTKEATVESRIKSNLNNIQRSSRHMDTHFSRR